MIERLNAIEGRYHEIENELSNPEVYSNMNKMKTLSKEKSDLEETVLCYQEYKKVLEGISFQKIQMMEKM